MLDGVEALGTEFHCALAGVHRRDTLDFVLFEYHGVLLTFHDNPSDRCSQDGLTLVYTSRRDIFSIYM
jgi:hypothetical protein